MNIEYKSDMKAVCTNADKAIRKYGLKMGEKLHMCLDQIKAADNIEYLVQYQVSGCHALKGKRKNQYAMVLVQPFRLVFEVKGNDIQIAKIIEVTDYH